MRLFSCSRRPYGDEKEWVSGLFELLMGYSMGKYYMYYISTHVDYF
jgi:hypothetical protein